MPIHDPIFNEMEYLLGEGAPTGFEDDQYTSLNDGERHESGLAPGRTEIWYMQPSSFTRFIMGSEKPTIKDLKKTHILLGKIKETNPRKLYKALQGDFWSPNGEASQFIQGLKLQHTSMSIGDVFKFGNKHYVIAPAGFEEIK